jgi:hypothetical protein
LAALTFLIGLTFLAWLLLARLALVWLALALLLTWTLARLSFAAILRRAGGVSLPIVLCVTLTFRAGFPRLLLTGLPLTWLLPLPIVPRDLFVQFARQVLQFFAGSPQGFRLVSEDRFGRLLDPFAQLANAAAGCFLLLAGNVG